MENLKFLAIDLGASSGRGILGTFDGERLSLSEQHRFSNDPVMVLGRYRWDILRIFHEIKQAIRAAHQAGGELRSLGIDTWGVDYGLLDAKGELLADPMHYRDVRTRGLASAQDAAIPPEELYRITGIQSLDFNTVYQLFADRRDTPELLSRAKRMLFIPDLLNYFLTGVAANEYTVASTSALLDAAARRPSREIFDRFGLPHLLADALTEPGVRLGGFSRGVREELDGFDCAVVTTASHDTASAVLAVPAEEEDFAYISSGTWSLMGTERRAPLVSAESRAWNFSNEGGVCGTFRVLKNIMGLWTVQESRRQWQREGTAYSFADLQTLAEAEKPLRSLIDPDDPRFVAPGDLPARVVDYCRQSGQKTPENVGAVVRTLLESLALRYRYTMEGIEKLTGKPVRRLHIVGGGTKDTFLCQLAADACGVPVTAGPTEATAMGNLCMQLAAAGEVRGLDEMRALVRRSSEVKTYLPCADRAPWEEAYGRFCRLIGGRPA